jgi:5-methyltetrahydropteroyltriglutamate--homocysteine methyltransferase
MRSSLIQAYQHGIYPRSEDVVAATRGLERGRTSADEVADAFKKDRVEFVDVQQEAGLDFFSDGLLRWQDIFRPLVDATEGMEARTLVRWFNNNSFFRAPEPAQELRLSTPLLPVYEESDDIPEPRVATLPSPYLFSRAAQTTRDRNELMVELAAAILRPVVTALSGRGYKVIQLQEPWLVYFGSEEDAWRPFEKALGEIKDGTGGHADLVLHTYFGDAAPIIDRLRNLPVDAVGIDLVETDAEALGKGWNVGVLAGCLDGRSSIVESVESTVQLARQLAETVGSPQFYISSNCDLEFLPRDVAREKVLRLGEIARRLKEELG